MGNEIFRTPKAEQEKQQRAMLSEIISSRALWEGYTVKRLAEDHLLDEEVVRAFLEEQVTAGKLEKITRNGGR